MIRSTLWQFARSIITAVMIASFAVPQTLIAQAAGNPAQAAPHLVSPSDLQKSAVDASQARQQNIDTVNNLLATDQAQQALKSAHLSPQQVKTAVAGMSDEELAQLAARAQKAQDDFAAGMGDHDMLLVILVIVIIIVVIVAVH